MPRGRKPKASKQPTTLERTQKLRDRILNLRNELIDKGFSQMMKSPGTIRLTEEPDKDPKTGGQIGKVKEPLATYIQRVSVADNFSQRPPFDHVMDSIYRRLIKDFIAGAAMPESKVAALSSSDGHKTESLEEPEILFSLVDGLQRLYCYCIAILVTLYRDQLVSEGYLPVDAWKYLAETVSATGEPRSATEKLLRRMMRYEVFYNIDLAGLLHYMVTFNTGQRRMSLDVQLEIMRAPLIQELEHQAGVPIWHDIQKTPGMQQPKGKFAASDLVLATQAFITNNAQITASIEAERFLNEDQAYLDNVGDITDVVKTLRRITTEIHPEIMRAYAADANKSYLLSGGGTFLLGFIAACGYVRNRNNMKMLDGALDKLLGLLKRPVDDPLNLEAYQTALAMITTSRGKTIRRLVDDTFRRFFMGATTELEWLDTAHQITGV